MGKLIKQPYHLTVSKNNYNIHEQRILLRVLEELQSEMAHGYSPISIFENLETGKLLRFKTRSLMIKNSKNYTAVRNALKSLLNKEIYMRGIDKKNGLYEIRSKLITEYRYFLNNEAVELAISRSVLAYLISVTSYTRYSFSVAFNSSSPYTSRIYQYLSHWRDKPSNYEIPLKASVLRETLLLEGKYHRANSIKQVILEPAAKELKAKADVWFEIKEPIKESRKVVGWKIAIHKKESEEHKKKDTVKKKRIASLPEGTPQESEIPVNPEKLEEVKTLFNQKLVQTSDQAPQKLLFKKLKNENIT